jgi:hypothetical protein
MTFEGTHFFTQLDYVLNASDYHFNDSHLGTLVSAVHDAWAHSMTFADKMDPSRNGLELFFRMPQEIPTSLRQGELAECLPETAQPLYDAFRTFLKYVKENYVEVDIGELEREAIKQYQELIARSQL